MKRNCRFLVIIVACHIWRVFPSVMKAVQTQRHRKHKPPEAEVAPQIAEDTPYHAQVHCRLSSGWCLPQTHHTHTHTCTQGPLKKQQAKSLHTSAPLSPRTTKQSDNECWRRYGSKEASAAARLCVWSLFAAARQQREWRKGQRLWMACGNASKVTVANSGSKEAIENSH